MNSTTNPKTKKQKGKNKARRKNEGRNEAFSSQASTSNPPQKSRKPKRRKPKKKVKYRNWLELPEDVWFNILSRLKTIDVIENAQKVCMLWRQICKDPSMFTTIDMYLPDAFNCLPYNVNTMARFAVDRSAGQLREIYLEYLCNDETLMYIADRSKNLRSLRLGHYVSISDEGLIEALKTLPMLEEIQLIICSFSHETIVAIGQTCPLLNSFSLTGMGVKNPEYQDDVGALSIARSMPNLHHLQLIGNNMTNTGLTAILDGCPKLESLDLRACFHIDLLGDLGKRCEKIKCLRFPEDSTADYGRDTTADSQCFGYSGPESYEYYDYYGDSDFDYDDYTNYLDPADLGYDIEEDVGYFVSSFMHNVFSD